MRKINSSQGTTGVGNGFAHGEQGVHFHKTVLPSGLRIITESLPSMRSLSLGIWIDVGSRDELPEENGISHFIEHAVFKGTRRRKTHHIAQYLEAVGGYVNASTGKDTTCYYARVRDQHVDRAVDLLSDIILHPRFDMKEVEKEKQVIIEEMRSVEDDPEDIIHDYFEKNIFGKHPLGQPVIGIEENIKSFTPNMLAAFVALHYTARNMTVAAAGKLEHDHLVEMVGQAFAALPPGPSGVKRRKPRGGAPRQEVYTKPVQQAHRIVGKMVEGYHSSATYTLAVLSALLGEGMSSRLFQIVREKYGYAYDIYSFANLLADSGVFGVYIGAENGNLRRSRELIARVLDDVRKKPVSIRELNRAREQVIGSTLLGLESMTARMTRIGRDEMLFNRYIPVDEYLRELQSITPDNIHDLADQVCDHSSYSSTTIIPA